MCVCVCVGAMCDGFLFLFTRLERKFSLNLNGKFILEQIILFKNQVLWGSGGGVKREKSKFPSFARLKPLR